MTGIAGVVLAAGFGRRLRPLTELTPKPLCPVGNVPLVDLAIAHVRTITDVVAVNAHHHRDQMEAHLAHQDVHLSIEESEPLGTAGALGLLRGWIGGRPTLVHNSDAWHAAPDLTRVLLEGWDGERIRLLVVDRERAGTVTADFDDGTTFAGVSLSPWRDIARLEPVPTGLWEVSWRQAHAQNRLQLIRYDDAWFDTGTPTNYLAANLATSGGDNVIAPDAVVDPTARVVRSVVWPGAVVSAGERLHEQIRAPGPVTVDAPQCR